MQSLLVSIGTGKSVKTRRSAVTRFYQEMYSHFRTVKAIASDTNAIHNRISSALNRYGHYCRLNVEKGLGDVSVPLDACKGEGGVKTLDLIRQRTEEYLEQEPAKTLILDSAETLVAIRRARSIQSDRDRWETYCHGLEYKCPVLD